MVCEVGRRRMSSSDELAKKLDAEFIESRREWLASKSKSSLERNGPPERRWDIPVEDGDGVSTFDAGKIKELLDTKNVIGKACKKLYGLDVNPDTVASARADRIYPPGASRHAYLLSLQLKEAAGSGLKDLDAPPFVLKISNSHLSNPKGGTEQLVGYYADPDPNITPPIGGLWVSRDREIVLTEDYVRGPTLEHVILKGGRKERAEREVVAQSLRFWKKTGGYAIRDPHPSNFKITEDSMKTDAPKVLLIDTGDVARQDPKTFTENFFQWYEVMPHLAGNIDYVPQKGDNVPETFSRASFIEGAVCALGERDGIAFLKEATKDASKDKRTLGLKKALDDYRATQKPIQK